MVFAPERSFLPGHEAFNVPPQLRGLGKAIGDMVQLLRGGAAVHKSRVFGTEMATQCVLLLSAWSVPGMNPRVALTRSVLCAVALCSGVAAIKGLPTSSLMQTWPDICYVASAGALIAAGNLKKSQQGELHRHEKAQ